jgi:NAD(P)-dependent dehydrogenase (short-subunit alcohol dehydrogenase family)
MNSSNPLNKVVLITGASSGIGKSCAELLAAKGYRVYGTSRRLPSGTSLFEMVKMDVLVEKSVQDAVKSVIDHAGRLDVLVNNAGMIIVGPVEDTPVEEAKRVFDTNLFGVLRVTKAVIPTMRDQGAGLIINVSSIGGIIGLPFQGIYSASKFALEGMCEALGMELREFNIRVVLVEPGDIKTPLRAHGLETVVSPSYKESFGRTYRVIRRNEERGGEPQLVAEQVLKIIQRQEPRIRNIPAIPI